MDKQEIMLLVLNSGQEGISEGDLKKIVGDLRKVGQLTRRGTLVKKGDRYYLSEDIVPVPDEKDPEPQADSVPAAFEIPAVDDIEVVEEVGPREYFGDTPPEYRGQPARVGMQTFDPLIYAGLKRIEVMPEGTNEWLPVGHANQFQLRERPFGIDMTSTTDRVSERMFYRPPGSSWVYTYRNLKAYRLAFETDDPKVERYEEYPMKKGEILFIANNPSIDR